MKKIGIIVGSLHKESINRKIAQSFVQIGHPDLSFSFIDISALPLFSEDLEQDLPQSVTEFCASVRANDLILIMTPEYNRAIPGVLKNALDWASRPYGKGALSGKEGAIAGASLGGAGTATAQVQLRALLPSLGMVQIRHPEMCIVWKSSLLNENNLPTDKNTTLFFKKFLDALAK